MAEPLRVSAPEAGPNEQTLERRVGIRFPGSSVMTMCESGEGAWTVGDWVLVDDRDGKRAGRVVVAPGRWRGTPGASACRVLGTLSAEEIAAYAPVSHATPATGLGTEVGSVGLVQTPQHATPLSSSLSLGGEDERFRRLKLGLPRLGQRVRSGDGHCIVVAIDIVSRSVTCVVESDGAEIVVPAKDLLEAFPE